MKNILLFGAGKSSTYLIDYLNDLCDVKNWNIIVADFKLENIASKLKPNSKIKSVEIDIENTQERTRLISSADIVISLMPPHLHYLIALDCIELNKNLLTASYIDNQTKELAKKVEEKNLLFIYELGLDPGIDHMSAMKIIHEIQHNGGEISSFISHCGGLVAPESDDNPWHYKISWNPKNIVMAGKAGATFLENGNIENLKYEELFSENNLVQIPESETLSFYPNRDSLTYIDNYGLNSAKNFKRTTLRHVDFCFGWKNIIQLKLTDESIFYNTENLTISKFFNLHFKRFEICKLDNENILLIKLLNYLGLNDNSTFINIGSVSAVEVLQFILEKKLILKSNEKDMIVMLHEFEYIENNVSKSIKSLLRVIGENSVHTAMAKTVGLPLGITAKLILEEKINEVGLMIPIMPSIYNPVLNELEKHGIIFNEFIN